MTTLYRYPYNIEIGLREELIGANTEEEAWDIIGEQVPLFTPYTVYDASGEIREEFIPL